MQYHHFPARVTWSNHLLQPSKLSSCSSPRHSFKTDMSTPPSAPDPRSTASLTESQRSAGPVPPDRTTTCVVWFDLWRLTAAGTSIWICPS